MKTLLKLVHLLGLAGLAGSVLAALVLAHGAAAGAPGDQLSLRQTSVALLRLVMVPALLATVVSGMLLMVVHAPYAQAGWVWAKGGLGAAIAAVALFGVQPQVTRSAALAAEARSATAALSADMQTAWRDALQAERRGAWLVLGLSLAASALGVWRPRFGSGGTGVDSRV